MSKKQTSYKLPLTSGNYWTDGRGNKGKVRCDLIDAKNNVIARYVDNNHAQSLVLAANMFPKAVEIIEILGKHFVLHRKTNDQEGIDILKDVQSFPTRIKEASHE